MISSIQWLRSISFLRKWTLRMRGIDLATQQTSKILSLSRSSWMNPIRIICITKDLLRTRANSSNNNSSKQRSRSSIKRHLLLLYQTSKWPKTQVKVDSIPAHIFWEVMRETCPGNSIVVHFRSRRYLWGLFHIWTCKLLLIITSLRYYRKKSRDRQSRPSKPLAQTRTPLFPSYRAISMRCICKS